MRKIFILTAIVFFPQLCDASFEETSADARVFGLAGAGVALADFPQGGAFNPALPAYGEEQSVSAGASIPFGLTDLSATAASASYQRERFGAGAALVTAGNRLYRESAFRMALGMRLFERVALGMAVTGQHLGIERYGSATAIGLDAGLIGSPAANLDIAVAARNLNHPALGGADEEIGQALSCGAAFRPVGQVTLALQVEAQKGWPVQLRVGQEYRWRERLSLRAGFADRPDQASLGFGAAWGRFRLDYAVRTHPVLDLSHCVSLHCRTQRRVRTKPAIPVPMVRTDPRSLVRLDLNTASRADLLLLPGVGETTAGRILALRDSLGTVATLNDLLLAGGLTYRDLERIAPYAAQGLRRTEAAPGKVNLNTATAQELCALPGIGPGTAADIIEYRAQHGPFTSADDLTNVRGIGRVKLEQLRELVTVGP